MTTPDYSDFTQDQIDAERAAIQAERAALSAARAGYQVPIPSVPDAIFEQRVISAADVVHSEAARQAEIDGLLSEGDTPSEVNEPAPWPHEVMEYAGLKLEIRIPDQSALVAISMLEMLDGNGAAQLEIFNTFLANHLSQKSLIEVIKDLSHPDTKINLQELIQQLVRLRTEGGSES